MNIFDNIHEWLDKVGTYRMIVDTMSYQHTAFIVEVRGLLKWHVVKIFISDDAEYARNCAQELLEMLEEEIEPTETKK